jgi:hypothetical protein
MINGILKANIKTLELPLPLKARNKLPRFNTQLPILLKKVKSLLLKILSFRLSLMENELE